MKTRNTQIRNPLRRRYLRELKGDLGKYLVIFLLIAGTIAIVSGCVVAQGSMARAYEESFEKYRTEDGEFVTEKEMTRAQRKRITALGVQVYDKLYSDQRLTNGTKLRFFRNRSEVDLACLFDGAFPEAADEIAIDRMYADNNELSIGDTVTIGEGTESAGRSE